MSKVRKQFKRQGRSKPGKRDPQDKHAERIMGKGATGDVNTGSGRRDDKELGTGESGGRAGQV